MRAASAAYRDFAHDNPNSCKLMFSASSLRGEVAESIRTRAALPVITYLTGIGIER